MFDPNSRKFWEANSVLPFERKNCLCVASLVTSVTYWPSILPYFSSFCISQCLPPPLTVFPSCIKSPQFPPLNTTRFMSYSMKVSLTATTCSILLQQRHRRDINPDLHIKFGTAPWMYCAILVGIQCKHGSRKTFSTQCTHLATRLCSITTATTGQTTISSGTQSDLLMMGIKMPETCWDTIDFQ